MDRLLVEEIQDSISHLIVRIFSVTQRIKSYLLKQFNGNAKLQSKIKWEILRIHHLCQEGQIVK